VKHFLISKPLIRITICTLDIRFTLNTIIIYTLTITLGKSIATHYLF
jgi:hypothetical protein